jgi:ribosomal protein S18 acetylase RimI-like enzyme
MTVSAEVVAARKKDTPRLVEIFSNADLKTSREESQWFVNCYMDYHHVLLAKVDDDIQGACFWRIEGERYSGLGWIENIWVEERFRKLGLGEKLLSQAVNDIKSFFRSHGVEPRKVVLLTQTERRSARRLYEKVGFRQVASIEGMYDPGGHDMLYLLDL